MKEETVEVPKQVYERLLGIVELSELQNNLLFTCQNLVEKLGGYKDSLPPEITEAIKEIAVASFGVMQYTSTKLKEFNIDAEEMLNNAD